ncbi:pyruvate, water dikinase regulatory protein [Lacticaseibacillus nasuensis]|jgi:regulator of PEP synthase PpsR (kinase-PPPase family)|uniref:pyruvate, water dikinase regulatory protein n=1 Tax=Lacticaseibacillus nasuensis TaxID=944671 RepID=UPI0022480B08|nr:pyruvate, water dikinase regulatory protein [Lacticaseibacillus nasuensis]MCX2454824.1 kinase/pyrophosphorylase [Lacticaseibacillus nasuensis]
MQTLNLYIISDSIGETGLKLAQAVAAQYPDATAHYLRSPFVHTEDKLMSIIDQAKQDQGIVISTLVTPGLGKLASSYAKEAGVPLIDVLSPILAAATAATGVTPSGIAGANHDLNEKYFDRISAMEFAVLYDDGKDPKGFLEADIVLLGVSRTSKTPLSLFLANRNLKVANLPLVPNAHIPDEIYQIDPQKIIGLTTDASVLMAFRRQRMIAYGLNPDTAYSARDSVNAELKYATDLYAKLGCYVINTAKRSIEETAMLILEHLGMDTQ